MRGYFSWKFTFPLKYFQGTYSFNALLCLIRLFLRMLVLGCRHKYALIFAESRIFWNAHVLTRNDVVFELTLKTETLTETRVAYTHWNILCSDVSICIMMLILPNRGRVGNMSFNDVCLQRQLPSFMIFQHAKAFCPQVDQTDLLGCCLKCVKG